MKYLYGEFTNKQIIEATKQMHNDIHKLLLYKDLNITETIFKNDEEFLSYFNNLLFRFGGLNELFNQPPMLVSLMSTLQAAYDEVRSNDYKYTTFRRAILDSHGYIKAMFEEVDCDAKSFSS